MKAEVGADLEACMAADDVADLTYTTTTRGVDKRGEGKRRSVRYQLPTLGSECDQLCDVMGVLTVDGHYGCAGQEIGRDDPREEAVIAEVFHDTRTCCPYNTRIQTNQQNPQQQTALTPHTETHTTRTSHTRGMRGTIGGENIERKVWVRGGVWGRVSRWGVPNMTRISRWLRSTLV